MYGYDGYCTDYDISENDETVQEAIAKRSGYNFYDGQMYGKWYKHGEDCLEVSKQFPDTIIYLKGFGEEQWDQWKKYFKNGKQFIARAVVTFEEFDESKLK